MSDSTEHTCKPCDDDAVEEKRENRNLKNWVIKTVINVICFIISTFALAAVYGYVILGKSFEHSAIGAGLTSLVEIVKFVFQ